MKWNDRKSPTQLAEAVQTFDHRSAHQICHAFVQRLWAEEEACQKTVASKVLETLRRKRLFDLTTLVSEALLQTGSRSWVVYRQYVQALIELGSLIAAERTLLSLLTQLSRIVPKSEAIAHEYNQLRGLLGRVYKQRYVNDAMADRRPGEYLQKAIDHYQEVFKDEPEIWHGINVVALLWRARHDNVKVTTTLDFEALAKTLLERIERSRSAGDAGKWEYATAVEACLALNDPRQAAGWLSDYLHHAEADHFEYGSTYRQFKEIWLLDPTESPGDLLLAPLYSRVLRRPGGDLQLSSGEILALQGLSKRTYEKVYGVDESVSLRWMYLAMARCQLVGKVVNTVGQGVGTGFLVKEKHLFQKKEAETDRWLFLTNSHVVSARGVDHTNPDRLRVEFSRLKKSGNKAAESVMKVKKVIMESPPKELDYSIVSLDGKIKHQPESPSLNLNELALGGEERIYIIGHPLGGDLQLSLHDNHLLDMDSTRMHYRTPTRPGSSGSPVFDSEWNLIGIHHMGSWEMRKLHDKEGIYEANQGIRLKAIRKDIAAK